MKGVSEKERDGLARRKDAVGKKVGGLEKRKDVVRIVLQSGPLRLRADKDRECNSSNFVLVLKCNGHVSV